MVGLGFLLGAVAVALALALVLRWRNGKFVPARDSGTRTNPEPGRPVLTVEEIGIELGDRATLVQFSSAFCSPCRATRVILADVAKSVEGVAVVDVDAESHLELVNRLGIMRTPTVLVLDPSGAVVTRASGIPRREQVLTALASA